MRANHVNRRNAVAQPLEPRRLLANIVVNSTADNAIAGDGLTTLREAIIAANATPAVDDTIMFDLGAGPHTINLAGVLPDLSSQMIIKGPGHDLLTVRRDTGGQYRIFTIPAAAVALNGLTITNGIAGIGTLVGGGIYNAGTLALDDCTVSDNGFSWFGGFGGGIRNEGVLTINNSTISGNNAGNDGAGIDNTGTATITNSTISDNALSYNAGAGGGIHSSGSLTVRNSTIRGNSAGDYATTGFYGGGIAAEGSLVVQNTTVNDNTAGSNGGGLWVTGSSAEITSCTFTGNRALGYGGGAIAAGGPTAINHCTITGNVADGFYGDAGGVNASSATTISNSIIAGNVMTSHSPGPNPDIYGSFADGGYNFIGGDPGLAPLADNGGPTQTMALLPDSRCINHGDPNFVGPSDYDQRGAPFARKIGPRIDIGAFESAVLNTAPTAAEIPAFTVLDDGADSVINLRDFFEDGEDGAAGLVYTLVGNTNPPLFTSTSIDDATDALTLNYAEGAEGITAITVRGTDSAGLFVDQTFDVTVLLSSFVVNSTADDSTMGDGLTTLREAITAANLNGDANTISFDLGAGAQTINLTAALPDLSTDMTIEGPGADLLTVRRDAGGDYSVFAVGSGAFTGGSEAPTVTLAGMTITNGRTDQGGGGVVLGTGALAINGCVITQNAAWGGAGIYDWGGTLSLNNTVVSDNVAESYGGGMFIEFVNSASALLKNSIVRGNTAGYDGGGIYSAGTLVITASTVSGNSAEASAGGILSGGPLTLSDSTISGNRVLGDFGQQEGGGILQGSDGPATVSNSTISGNSAPYGGAIANSFGNTLTLNNCTIAANTTDPSSAYGGSGDDRASAAVDVLGALLVNNTVIAANTGGDVFSDFADPSPDTSNHNFIGEDHPGVDPLLAPLADNGGPTQTMKLMPGSPLINAGDPDFTAPPDFDQRGAGFARVSGGRIDIGAFELDSTAPAVQSAQFNYITGPQSLKFAFSENVGRSLDVSDLLLENLSTGATVPAATIAINYDANTNTAIFTMPGCPFGALPDGNYRATLAASGVSDPSGNALLNDAVLTFSFLNGDANGDRHVDLTDFTVLASHFNQSVGTFGEGDFNYDGTVDLTDFTLLAVNFNRSLAMATELVSASRLPPTAPKSIVELMANQPTVRPVETSSEDIL